MEDIATAAGVTKPLLYQHFPSKRSLYLELIDDIASRMLEALDAARAEPDWRRRVEAGMVAWFRFVLHNESAVRMLFGAPRDEELARGLRRIEVAIAGFVAPLIEADIEEEHRRIAASAVVGMTEGVTRLATLPALPRRVARRQDQRGGGTPPGPAGGGLRLGRPALVAPGALRPSLPRPSARASPGRPQARMAAAG